MQILCWKNRAPLLLKLQFLGRLAYFARSIWAVAFLFQKKSPETFPGFPADCRYQKRNVNRGNFLIQHLL
jgi:hypothetical protein